MDSWEDEEFDIPTFTQPNHAASTNSWDDEEEDEALKPEEVTPGIGSEKPVTAKQTSKQERKLKEAQRKAEEEEVRKKLQAEVEARKNETDEQRRLREKKEIERSDNQLTESLFGTEKPAQIEEEEPTSNAVAPPPPPESETPKQNAGAESADIETIPLKTLQDHMALAMKLGKRLSTGKDHHVLAFFKEMLRSSTQSLTPEHVGELIALANVIKNDKVKASKAKSRPTKKQQKQDAEAKAKHVETFGGDFDGYDSSHDQVYDDFM